MSYYCNGYRAPRLRGMAKTMAMAIVATGFFATVAIAATTAPSSQPTTQPSASQPAIDKPTQLVNEVVRAYLKTQQALTKGDLPAAKEPTSTVMRSGNALHEYRAGLAPLLSEIGTQAARANDSRDLAAFREAYARLSPAVIELVKRIPPTAAAAESLYAVHCPCSRRTGSRSARRSATPTIRTCCRAEWSRAATSLPAPQRMVRRNNARSRMVRERADSAG